MTDSLNAMDALALVPGWDPRRIDIEELRGGLTNRTYHVVCEGKEYVLRLDSEHSAGFQSDRSCELSILRQASREGLAPEIVFSDARRGLLITRFLSGQPWDAADLESNRNLEALAALLRRVHALPLSGIRINMADIATNYETCLEISHALHEFANSCVRIIGEIPLHEVPVCCHNDIVAANIIGGPQPRLIDWEYSCDNDPLFDLASAIGFHDLDERRAGILLNAYSGGADAGLQDRLTEQVRVYDAIQWLWLAARHLVLPSRWQARRLKELQQRIR